MKINVSMDFIKPLSGALKKYKALTPSVIITIVAILLFFPLLWMGSKVKEQMKGSVSNASSIKSLMSTPSREKVQQVKTYMDQLEEESEGIRKMAIQGSCRNLVTYDYVLFPEPKDPSSQVYNEFGQRYRIAIESLIRKMNALDAPSNAEIRARTGASRAVSGITRMGGRNVIQAQDPMVDALCLTRAQEISVYANPDVFSWYEFWSDYEFTGRDQALQDCWDSQVAFWIYEDIVDTVNKMNGPSVRVQTAPVKRILGLRFSGPVVVKRAGIQGDYGIYQSMGQMRDIPNYITSTLISNFVGLSPTGRAGDEDIDVVHFAASVVLDNRFVLAFMKELCSEKSHHFYPDFKPTNELVQSRHNQISILGSNVSVVESSQPEHELYRYGKGATVRLDLVCEYLFLREGYDAIKPEPIKKRLGQESAGSDQPGNQPGNPQMPMMMF